MPDTIDLTSQLPARLELTEELPPESEAHARVIFEGASEKMRQLDSHTLAFLKMATGAIQDWKRALPTARDIQAPRRNGLLPTVDLPFGNLVLPSLDEDWAAQGIARAVTLRVLRSRFFPVVDPDEAWASEAEARAAFDDALPTGTLLPEPNHHWDEMASDEAMSRLAFAGMAALRLLRVEGDDPDGATWVHDLSFMGPLEVRPGFERYGAIAWFDADQRPVRIFWCHGGRHVRPTDPEWAHAKWAWRCSLLVGTTVADHLVGVHWMIGNYVTLAARSHLRTDHPVRRLLKPFTWRTVTINYRATFSLCPERGFVHRATALTYPALQQAFEASVDLLRYRTVPELIARKRADGMGDAFPWATDALRLYDVFAAFVRDYLGQYYTGDELVRDPGIRAFWKGVQGASATVGIPALETESLNELLAQYLWCATGMHETVGAIIEYVRNPAFMGSKIRPGREVSDVQASVQALLIIGMTGLEMPGLLNDFSQVCLDARGRSAFDRLQQALRELSVTIDADNQRRRWPCNSFNPRYLECSVSV